MRFTETKLKGSFVIELEQFEDERGFLAPNWSAIEFAAHGLDTHMVEGNITRNRLSGTLRGMHFQRPPYAQPKLIRCTRGAIYDIAVDLRRDSPTFKQWVGVEFTEHNLLSVYLPAGFAHGYQTLANETDVMYLASQVYAPEYADGFRWDDPAFGIEWPACARRTIIDRDRAYPDFID